MNTTQIPLQLQQIQLQLQLNKLILIKNKYRPSTRIVTDPYMTQMVTEV
jgi:hypothetical protein